MQAMPGFFDPLSTWASLPWWAWSLLWCGASFVAASLIAKWWQRSSGADFHAPPAAPRREVPADLTRDRLTGLAVRTEFEAAVEAATWLTEHEGAAAVAVLHIGVDDLRGINDGFGSQAGDAALVQVARRLSTLPGVDSVVAPSLAARVGGDEFALLLSADEAGAIAMAAHVCATVARPFEVESESAGVSMGLTVSVGLACYPVHGAWSRLLPHAASAMRHVQRSGGNGHAVFSAAMTVDLRQQALLLQDLRQAALRGELRLLYQPKIDAESLQITAAEALLRWEHLVRGLVPPMVFIPLAERHGLIAAIGEWVIGEACRQAATWREQGLRMRIAINISGHQLRDDRFVALLEEQVRHHRIPPSRLTCEITESVAMEDTAQTRAAFQRLRQAGFHVSIDDFGTGHSSLAVLRRLPAAELKIDRGFVVDLEASQSARSIVEAVLGVARSLGMRVVAEGVETQAQRDILVRMGIDELQGFLFAQPMSAQSLALWSRGQGPAEAAGDPAATVFRPSLFHETRTQAIEH